MKLAIVSDVHGNLAALDSVIKDLADVKPDLIVHGGDLALNGPRPAECVDRIRELGWPGIVGNTDQALWTLPETLPEGARHIFGVMAAATTIMLGSERLAWLRALQLEWRDGDRVALVHAVPGDTWKVVEPDAPDAAIHDIYGPLRAMLAVYCHIHKPFVRHLGAFTLANSGSVGMPFDGDTRSSYLLITDGKPAIRRVAYDIESHVADVERSGYPTSQSLIERARKAQAAGLALDP